MKPAPFEYFAPTTIEETLSLLDEHGFDAKILAGGQSLVPTMNFRLAQPSVLIDINHVGGLSGIGNSNSDALQIGAMTRQRQVERSEIIAKQAPLITETMPNIAHPQIRNRGTIGGSLAHADPASELPAVMVALNARFKVQSQNEERWVAASDFFVDLFTTDLAPEELLTAIEVPALPEKAGYAFKEIARRHGDFALVGVAAVATLDDTGKCEQCRIVLMSVGNGPVQAAVAEQVLTGEKPTAKTIAEAAAIVAEKDIDPPADMHASSDFRRHLAKVLTEQALITAFERAKKD